MSRILAVAVLCALVTNVGCANLRKDSGCIPCNVQTLQNAPRPEVQRTAYHQPVGVLDMQAADGYGRGCGLLGSNGTQMVNSCVSTVIDCPPGCGCGDTCGAGGCGPGGCYAGAPGCTCGGRGGCPACLHKAACMARMAGQQALGNGACMSDAAYNFNPGPPTGQVAYPYYTTRGPRDFFMANPPSIGPN